MQRCFGWQPDCEHVVPVADLVQALFTAVSAFTERGQGVVVQTPIYPPFQNSIRETGRRIVEHRLLDNGTHFRLDVDSIADVFNEAAPVLLLCNPHNPTGRVFTRAELEAVAEVAVAKGLVVVADEVHAELAYPGGSGHIPFATLSPEVAERTITITSATKAYNIPGLRCGVMHFGSSALREQFRSCVPDRMLGIVNRFGIEATLAAWHSGAEWLAEVLGVLAANRARITSFLAGELPQVGYHSPEATYLAWLDFGAFALPSPPQPFLLEHARVALSDGSEFGPPGRSCVRLNFGTTPEILDEVLARTASAVRGVAK
jgi:cystathionine beta-lyase